MKGRLIVLEGLDGVGKQTQTDIVKDYIENELKLEMRKISFPNYYSLTGRVVKEYLDGKYVEMKNVNVRKSASMLFAMDRFREFFIKDENGKSLYEFYKDGGILLADRYSTSNIIYNSIDITDDNELKQFIDWIYKLEYEEIGLPKPDLVLFLDLHPKISMSNIIKRNEKTDKNENFETQLKLYENLKKMDSFKFLKWEFINCMNSDLTKQLSTDEIFNIIKPYIDSLLIK